MAEETIRREGEGSVAPTHIPTASAHESHAQHSPLPWALSTYVLNFGRVITRAEHLDRKFGASVDAARCRGTYMQTIASVSQHPCHLTGGVAEAEANAQFIVTACNSHDDLLAALKRLMGAENCCCAYRAFGGDHDCDCRQAQEAIVKAEGGQ